MYCLKTRKIRIFKFDVITTIPSYVKVEHIHDLLRQNGREDLSVKFRKMISGSTVYVYEREPKSKIGIYPWDVAAIFYRLKVDVCFQDEEGKILYFDKGMSGISDWI